MKYPTITCFLLSALALCAAEKPNILFIAIDDFRPELGCYGATPVKSPHIDKFASEGMVFTRAYCQVPVCGASRASLLTGMLPTNNRFVQFDTQVEKDAPGVMTLPEVFRNAGLHHPLQRQDFPPPERHRGKKLVRTRLVSAARWQHARHGEP